MKWKKTKTINQDNQACTLLHSFSPLKSNAIDKGTAGPHGREIARNHNSRIEELAGSSWKRLSHHGGVSRHARPDEAASHH